MALDISGLYFFMPVFSFLFVFFIIYALLATSKVLGKGKFVHAVISFIVAVVFMSFSSAELYVRTIIPWFIVLIVVVFLILMIAGFTKNLDAVMKPWFAWLIIIVLGIVFLVAAINVFNPVFHPDLIVTSSESGPGVIQQFKDFISSSKIAGSFILLVIAIIVAWVVTKK
tara:strand:- start:838 stop:1347 length:510 start_codon:yes stop_codon:yes gene_type:complete